MEKKINLFQSREKKPNEKINIKLEEVRKQAINYLFDLFRLRI
jgi:hypothetical protein